MKTIKFHGLEKGKISKGYSRYDEQTDLFIKEAKLLEDKNNK